MFFNLLCLNYIKTAENILKNSYQSKELNKLILNKQKKENLISTNYKNLENKNYDCSFSKTNNMSEVLIDQKNQKIKRNITSDNIDYKHLPLKKRLRHKDYFIYDFKDYDQFKNSTTTVNDSNGKIITDKKSDTILDSNKFNSKNIDEKSTDTKMNKDDLNYSLSKNSVIKYTGDVIFEQNNKKDICITKEIQNNDTLNTNIILNNKTKTNKRVASNEIILHINNEVKNLSNSKTFMILFKIVEQDLINILKNAFQNFYEENKIIPNLITLLEQNHDDKTKILNFVNVINTLLNINLEYDHILEFDKLRYMKLILCSKYSDTIKKQHVNNKINVKYKTLINRTLREDITYLQILKCTLKFVNELTDKNLKQLCLLGIQNFFIRDTSKHVPKFYFIIIMLYAYVYEKKYYDFDWNIKLFKILALKKIYYRKFDTLITTFYYIFKKKTEYTFYCVYFAMNSRELCYYLYKYAELQKNMLHFELLNNLVDMLDELKYKLFKITK